MNALVCFEAFYLLTARSLHDAGRSRELMAFVPELRGRARQRRTRLSGSKERFIAAHEQLVAERPDVLEVVERAIEVRPGRERGRCPRQAGDQRALGKRQGFRRAAEQMARHRLDAVNAGTQVDPVQIQLEDLLLRELRLDVQRQHRLTELAAVGLLVREKERARELLRQGGATLHVAGQRAIVPVRHEVIADLVHHAPRGLVRDP